MNRTTVIYILTALAFVAGLWGVLRIGSTLRAPADLSGEWAVWLQPSDPLALDERRTMVVTQSGRFVRAMVKDERGREVALSGHLNPAGSGEAAGSLRLESEDGSVTLEGLVSADGREIRGAARTPLQWNWSARRTGDAEDPLAVAAAADPAGKTDSSTATVSSGAADAKAAASGGEASAAAVSTRAPPPVSAVIPVADQPTGVIDGEVGAEPAAPPSPPAQ